VINLTIGWAFAGLVSGAAQEKEAEAAAPVVLDQTVTFRIEEVRPSFMAPMAGQRPAFGVRSTAAVGENMFTQYSYTVSVGARLRAPVAAGGANQDRHTVFPRNTLSALGDRGSVVSCTASDTNARRDGRPGVSCFVDKDSDGSFDRVRRPNGSQVIELTTPAPYDLIADRLQQVNFRYELVYLGKSGSTLRLGYREYSNELARPAFTTELTFDLAPSGPTVFRYRNLRITVHEVSNEGITYSIEAVAA
jgi:hypothetical protein